MRWIFYKIAPWLFLFIGFLNSCNNSVNKVNKVKSGSERIINDTFPSHFAKPVIPEDNLLTQPRIELGKKLFFSSVFSGDGKISCATCHKPQLAFADTVTISPGVNGRIGFRNSPSLVNIAWHPEFMLDGGVPTLELQVLAPFSGHDELDFSLLQAIEVMNKDDEWVTMSEKAYGRKPDTYVVTRALACYQRTLFDGNSKYDLYLLDSIKNPLSETEKKGMSLFFSEKTGCSSCHSGILFSDFTYQNIGLYKHYADTGRSRITLRLSLIHI